MNYICSHCLMWITKKDRTERGVVEHGDHLFHKECWEEFKEERNEAFPESEEEYTFNPDEQE